MGRFLPYPLVVNMCCPEHVNNTARQASKRTLCIAVSGISLPAVDIAWCFRGRCAGGGGVGLCAGWKKPKEEKSLLTILGNQLNPEAQDLVIGTDLLKRFKCYCHFEGNVGDPVLSRSQKRREWIDAYTFQAKRDPHAHLTQTSCSLKWYIFLFLDARLENL